MNHEQLEAAGYTVEEAFDGTQFISGHGIRMYVNDDDTGAQESLIAHAETPTVEPRESSRANPDG